LSLYTYDIETYPNVFTCVIKAYYTGEIFTFELSERHNDIKYFTNFIKCLRMSGSSMIGFNNIGFDYPIIHMIIHDPYITNMGIYQKCHDIINADKDQRFGHMIWGNQQEVRQIDLLKLNHFDNVSRMTSLKILEFNMRSGNIQDLPYPPGVPLTVDQIDPLIKYNINDVNETEKFYNKCLAGVDFRNDLSKKHGLDMINYNDTKIGKEYLIRELEKDSKGICFYKDKITNERKPHQTKRDTIDLGSVIFDYTKFEHPEMQRVLTWFNNKTIRGDETKGAIKDLECTIDGFTFKFGTGGIHGSVNNAVVKADDDYAIIDVDVASFYPNLAIVNKIFPEHLSEKFCEIYLDIYKQRKGFKKGTPENKMLKLALNGTYGDSNSPYSPFYDPAFTMGITINGQLSLCMLAEQLMKLSQLRMIQINTDGMTFLVHRSLMDHVRAVCKWWENITGLELEEALYSRMWVRDVNTYLCEYESGKVKRIGKYEYKLMWNQNHSALVVPKAAEAFLLHGTDPNVFLRDHDDIMDFMLRTKVPRTSRLYWGDKQIQNVSRYYISNEGERLLKIMPPLAKAPDKERPIGINVGWKVTECNNIVGISDFDINYNWYLQEIEALISYAR